MNLHIRRLLGNRALAEVVKNFGWLSSDRVLRMLIGLSVGIWTARYLGPERYGIYQTAIAITTIAGIIASMGLNGILLRDFSRYPYLRRKLIGTSVVIKLLGALGATILPVSILYFVLHDDPISIGLVALLSLAFFFNSTSGIDVFFQSQLLSKYPVICRGFGFLVGSGFKVFLILSHSALIYFGLVTSIEMLVGSVAIILIYRKIGNKFSASRFSFNLFKRLLSDSWSLIFSGLFVVINMNVDKIMIRYIIGEYSTGIYAIAALLSQNWYFIPVFLGMSVTPGLVNIHKTDTSRYDRRLQQGFNILSWISVSISILITFAASFLIQLLFGEEYMQAAPLLTVHVWSAVFVFHVSLRSQALTIEGKQRFVGLFSLIVMVSNVLLNIILIPRFQALGAAYASLFSWMIGAIVIPLFFSGTRRFTMMFLRSFFIGPREKYV